MDGNAGTFTLDSCVYDITVSKKRKKKGWLEEYRVDVFSLFDVLVHRAKSPYYSVLGLFDHVLTEEGEEVMGRACGDGVACVSLPMCLPDVRTLLTTASHEVLHTLGIDHTSDQRCIMNALWIPKEEWPFLCLNNLRKLKLFHEEGNAPLYRTSRFKMLTTNGGEDDEADESERDKDSSLSVTFIACYHAYLLQMIRADQGMRVYLHAEEKWLQQVVDTYVLAPC